MPAIAQEVPEGFQPDTPEGFQPDVPDGFVPDEQSFRPSMGERSLKEIQPTPSLQADILPPGADRRPQRLPGPTALQAGPVAAIEQQRQAEVAAIPEMTGDEIKQSLIDLATQGAPMPDTEPVGEEVIKNKALRDVTNLARGAAGTIGGAVTFATSPLGIGLVGAAAIPGVGPALTGYFLGDVAAAAAEKAGEASVTKEPHTIGEAATLGLMAGGIGKHLYKSAAEFNQPGRRPAAELDKNLYDEGRPIGVTKGGSVTPIRIQQPNLLPITSRVMEESKGVLDAAMAAGEQEGVATASRSKTAADMQVEAGRVLEEAGVAKDVQEAVRAAMGGETIEGKALETLSPEAETALAETLKSATVKPVERIRDDLTQAKPILDEIDAIVATARQRHAEMDDGQTKGLTHEFDMLTETEKSRLDELKNMIRPKSQAEAKSDVAKKRAERLINTATNPKPYSQKPVSIGQNVSTQVDIERITDVASRLGDEIETAPIHALAESQLRKRLRIGMEDSRVEDIEHGFMTSTGRFVGREEGYRIAKKSKQLKGKTGDPGFLGGEDLKPTTPAQATAKIEQEVKEPVAEQPLPVASDWTSATEEKPPTAAEPSKPKTATGPSEERHFGLPVPKFANRKMSPLDKVTTEHSAKVQKSFSEARRAQTEINKSVPSDNRQSAISVWLEAGGDVPTLQAWAAAAKGKVFKQAATDAQSLTPKEIAIANKVKAAFAVMEGRGNRFDVLHSHRDNYVTHVWDVKRPGTGWGGSMLKQRFRFSKARTFNTVFEGDQAGFKPKTLAIGKLLPAYIHEMNTVIADRQMVQDLVRGENADGSPMATPRGNVATVDGAQGKAVLVQPKMSREADTSDYRVMNDQPALSNWTWEGKDTDGKPVYVKADLALHPDTYRRVNAIIGQSAIRSWYRDPVSGLAQIPRAVARGLDTSQSAMKREMFGLLAPFHQVQEGTHGIGHLVNPFFGIPKIDLRNPAQMDAANHGLMLLPDRSSSRVYLEGVGHQSSLLSRGIRKIPAVGKAMSDVIDGYQDYLFHQYIPGLKFKTYEAMVARNTKLYEPELASGEMTPADVKITSAEQANAAYGHLNYALLDRNPTMQHLLQLGLLAPDFLEARSRFAGQAVKGVNSKVGHEQLKAIAILAAAQAGTAIILSNLLGDDWDPKHPFEVIHNGRRYTLRSVPEDIFGLLKDTRQFLYSRVNPLTVRGGVQLATGLNYRGEKVTALDTMEELLAGYIPITARSLPGIRSLTETGRNNPVSPIEQLAGSLGLRISRYSPISEVYKLVADWKEKNNIEKDRGSYPVSKYQQLRYALEDDDSNRADSAFVKLQESGITAKQIKEGFKASINHPFTGSRANDLKFRSSLDDYQQQMFDLSVVKRKSILDNFQNQFNGR